MSITTSFFRPETRWNSYKFKNSAAAPQSCSAMSSYYFKRAPVPTLSGGKQRSSLHTCPAALLGPYRGRPGPDKKHIPSSMCCLQVYFTDISGGSAS